MTTVMDRQEYTFQAEIKQLLHLLSHSLYQSREIALCELISNASDALDKMRYVALTNEAERDELPLEIVILVREAEGQLVIRDTGVGMTRDELATNLGTIAHSGSGEFLKALAAEERGKANLSLIGQFGVGFYSAFMIADRVQVRSRSYAEETAWEWESDGSGTFTITPLEGSVPRGTELVLYLKEDARNFASPAKIREVVRRYSSFVAYPIRLGPGGEVLNDQKPIWVEPKSQVTEEQYTRFYQHLSHHPEETPLWHLHQAADSPIQFRAIVYCPPTNLELLGFAMLDHGMNLCASVLVQSECRDLVPQYLRFLRGLVDCEDLPLNVSRETLQDNSVIRKIRTSLVKGVLDRLAKLASEEPDKYRAFYDQFGRMLKEGVVVDPANRERIAGLLRFASSHTEDNPEARVSLDEYLVRMPAGQSRIYYVAGPDVASIAKSPNLEIFRRRNLEVLYLTDPIDEFAVKSLGSYLERPLTAIDSAELELPETGLQTGSEQPALEEPAKESGFARVLELFRSALGARVSDVRESKRLTDSPCCLVNVDGTMSSQMQRLLKLANKEFAESAAYSRGESAVGIHSPALPVERQRRARSVHSPMRLAALEQRHDSRRRDARAQGARRAHSVVHDRVRREAITVDHLSRPAEETA